MTLVRPGTSSTRLFWFGAVNCGTDKQRCQCRLYDQTAGRKLLQDVYWDCVMAAIYRIQPDTSSSYNGVAMDDDLLRC
jgi:hypothetical protein